MTEDPSRVDRPGAVTRRGLLVAGATLGGSAALPSAVARRPRGTTATTPGATDPRATTGTSTGPPPIEPTSANSPPIEPMSAEPVPPEPPSRDPTTTAGADSGPAGPTTGGGTTAVTEGTASEWRVGVGAVVALGGIAGGLALRRWLRRRK